MTPSDEPTPLTDAVSVWRSDKHVGDTINETIELCRSLERRLSASEREAGRLMEAIKNLRYNFHQIKERPDWQDPEVGFMSGHISSAAIRNIDEALTGQTGGGLVDTLPAPPENADKKGNA